MDALEFFKTKERMCKNKCSECPLHHKNNGTNKYCANLIIKYPEKAVELVEKWAKENPIKTYKDDFLEKFPKVKINCENIPQCCCKNIYGHEVECLKITCVDCWNAEYKESVIDK